MKFFLVLGGFLGCSLAFASAIMAGSDPGLALWNGAIGCLAGAGLLAVFHYTLMSCVRSTVAEKLKISDAAAHAKESNNGS